MILSKAQSIISQDTGCFTVQDFDSSWCGAGAVVIAVSSATGCGNRHGWLPDDLNNGRLDLFFLFLAGQSHPFTTAISQQRVAVPFTFLQHVSVLQIVCVCADV